MFIDVKRMRRLIALGTVIVGVIGPLHASATTEPPVSRVDDGQAISTSAEQSLCETSLLVQLQPDQEFHIYDLALKAREPSMVVLSASSSTLSAAVLNGQIEASGVPARAGALLAWSMDSKEPPQVFTYDIGRLLASSQLAHNNELRSAMLPALQRQQRDLFWGRLEPIGANLQAPVLPKIEALRRDVMLTPVLIEIRRAAGGDAASLERRVAEKFVHALGTKDHATLRDLLDPSLFAPQQGTGQEWNSLRERFATRLVAGRMPKSMRGANLTQQEPRLWHAETLDHKIYLLQLAKETDSFPFVQSLEVK